MVDNYSPCSFNTTVQLRRLGDNRKRKKTAIYWRLVKSLYCGRSWKQIKGFYKGCKWDLQLRQLSAIKGNLIVSFPTHNIQRHVDVTLHSFCLQADINSTCWDMLNVFFLSVSTSSNNSFIHILMGHLNSAVVGWKRKLDLRIPNVFLQHVQARGWLEVMLRRFIVVWFK